jgi:hypothetical protein
MKSASMSPPRPRDEIAVLRGQPVEHAKYAGRRIFVAGINLTHLYHGSIPYLWYLQRELEASIYAVSPRPICCPTM